MVFAWYPHSCRICPAGRFRIGDPLLIGFAHAIDRDENLASLFATDRHGERIVEISSQ